MKLAACVIVKNEEDVILEWLAFHSIIGFDSFIVLDDYSTDATYAQVARAARHLDIRLMSHVTREKGRQAATYGTICRLFAREFHRIAFIDADEFLLPTAGTSIRDIPSIMGPAPAIAVPWLMFGSSGHIRPPPGLIIENYTQRSDYSFAPNRHAKTILRPSLVDQGVNPHYFEAGGGYVNADLSAVEWERDGLMRSYPAHSPLVVNHYFTRSRADWERRLARGQLGRTPRSWAEFETYDQNEVTDLRASAYAPAVRALMRELRGE